MQRLIARLRPPGADHHAVFQAFADGLARMIAPRRPAARVLLMGEWPAAEWPVGERR